MAQMDLSTIEKLANELKEDSGSLKTRVSALADYSLELCFVLKLVRMNLSSIKRCTDDTPELSPLNQMARNALKEMDEFFK